MSACRRCFTYHQADLVCGPLDFDQAMRVGRLGRGIRCFGTWEGHMRQGIEFDSRWMGYAEQAGYTDLAARFKRLIDRDLAMLRTNGH
jgi:hypothetical protein